MNRPMRRWMMPLWTAVLMLGALAGFGCQDVLFPADAPRTQYDRFDALRGQASPREDVGRYGDPVPALRERLRPYN